MSNRVSVIIPVYNSERTILQVIESVCNQSSFHEILEIIIINDGSTDQSEFLLKKFMGENPTVPIHYYYQDNSGVSVARNRGMRLASAEYIAFIDSDDVWLPHKLQRQLEIFDSNPEVVFLGAAYNNKPFIRKGKHITELYKADIKDIYWSYFPVTPSVIFKRSAIDKVGYFNENQRYGEDIGYYQKFCLYFNYYYLPEKLVEIGIGKTYFAQTGLTSNLQGMHEGELANLKYLYENKHISSAYYYFMFVFMKLKYCKRLLNRYIRTKIKKQ